MDAAPEAPESASAVASPSWPPVGMTMEWAEAVEQLSRAVTGTTFDSADQALQIADGDEALALRYLTENSPSEIQLQREKVVAAARAAGDVNRVSALKEAEIRRKATGSAQGFFKAFVDVEGQYVDQGYVDEDADAMGKLAKTFKGWFGQK